MNAQRTNVDAALQLDRRHFLKGSAAAAGGLVLGLYRLPADAQAGPFGHAAPIEPSAFIHVGTDGTVTLTIHKPENGQGAETAIAQLLADELEADWSRVRTVFAPIAPIYGGPLQGTFGSMGVRTSWEPMRRTGAAAREMLVQAAAAHWGVPASACRAENGFVVNTRVGARLPYGRLADAAAKLPVPPHAKLKAPGEFRYIGKPIPRRDTAAKIHGKATYGIDIHVPGMVYAVVARCPVPGGRVRSFDAAKARAVPGVVDVVQIPQGVAVVARHTWAAIQGRKALEIEWDEGPNAALSSAGIRHKLRDLSARRGGAVAVDKGVGAIAAIQAAKTVEAVYEAPYLAHAMMEPLNALAVLGDGRCEIWTGTQIPGVVHSAAVKASGLAADRVKVHTLYMGGSFGGRGGGEAAAEAVEVAKRVGKPVKVQWTREDDIQHDRYRPASCVRLAAGLDETGTLTAFTGRVACSSFAGLHNGVDREAVAGLADVRYAIPNLYFEYHEPGIGIPTNYWRSVGHSQNTFFAESFIDELADAAGQDPVAFRRKLLAKEPRLLAVLNLAAEKAGWGKPLAAGRFHGVAVVHCFGSYNAQIAEVSVEDGKPRVHRVVSAVDCGRAVNPHGVEQQMRGAIVYGLSAALRGEITIEHGRTQQANFDTYEPLRMKEMPVVEVHVVPSDAPPGGMGEVGTPAIAPAVTNALYRATGKRVRRLPIGA